MNPPAKREHSPDYPSIGLKEAVDRMSHLYKSIQRHAAPRELVAKGLGYNSLNGASMGSIAALRKFGLLLKKGDTLRLSERATHVLFPGSDEEREKTLTEAALTPPLYAEMHGIFGWDIPNDELVTNYLVRKGFLLRSAGVALSAYKDTAALVSGFASDYTNSSTSEDEEEEENVSAALALPAPDRAFPSARAPANVSINQTMPTPTQTFGATLDLNLNEPSLSIRGNTVRIEALLDFDGLSELEGKIQALKMLMKPSTLSGRAQGASSLSGALTVANPEPHGAAVDSVQWQSRKSMDTE